MIKSKLYLIGSGPGSLDLLTLKGKKCIEESDTIVYDRLIDKRILDFAKRDAELIYVGKESESGGKGQEDINRILLEKYKEGRVIARIKGGDSFVFGRGGEEILYCQKYIENLNFELVPGVTSAISAPECAGIPATHRGVANSFHVFTGHISENGEELDYKTIAKLQGSLIFLMGIKNIGKISRELMENGKNPKTPVAIIEKGTTNSQRVTLTTLENMEGDCLKNSVVPPAIIFIGDCVNLRASLAWLEKGELFGKKILITRDSVNSSEFSSKLISMGAEVIELPFIEIQKNSIEIPDLKEYRALLFNSPNGVKCFMDKISDVRVLSHLKIGVVGDKTQEELEKFRITPDFKPKKYTMNELVKNSIVFTEKEDKVLIITSDISPCELMEWREEYSRDFNKIVAYNTLSKNQPVEVVIKSLESCEYITFLSSSAVNSFCHSLNGNLQYLKGKKIISIGEVTSKTIKENGLDIYLEAKEFSVEGVIESIKGDCNV